ncbi:MAG: C1 family peptidase [Verrucomicrobiales bacterium]|nr:C1 family peptidase [Verrucomicrobiales bacterium]
MSSMQRFIARFRSASRRPCGLHTIAATVALMTAALLSDHISLQAAEGDPELTATTTQTGIELRWAGEGTLEYAPALSGPWIPASTLSPQPVLAVCGARFFRVSPPGGPAQLEVSDYGYDPGTSESAELVDTVEGVDPPVRATVVRKYLPPVGRQGTAASPGSPGSCAAWASTYGLATFTAAKAGDYSPTGPAQWASPAAIYVHVLKDDRFASNVCHGTQMTSYFSILSKGGTATLETAPYTPSCKALWADYGDASPSPDARFTLPPVKAIATTNLAALKRVIASNRVLTFGTGLFTDWSSYDGTTVPYVGNGIVAKEKDGSRVGHCMMIVGYDDELQAVLIQNSEGSDWGGTFTGAPPNAGRTDAGYVWMAYCTFTALAQGRAFFVP